MTKPDTSTSCEIPLSSGYVAIVDAEDYEFLMQWNWYARAARGHVYLRTTEPVSVSLENMIDVYLKACASNHNPRDKVATLLKAAGIPYVD